MNPDPFSEDPLMLLCTSTILAVLLAVTPAQPNPAGGQDAAAKKELQRFQGGWQIESHEENGKAMTAGDLKGRTLFFGGEGFLLRQNNAIVQIARVKLDPTKDPKAINAVVMLGPGKGDAMLGIYTLDGDTLKICFDVPGNERPKEFKTTPDSGRLLLVCKRLKSKYDQPDLSGTYRSESTEIDGSKHVAEAVIERMGDAYLVTYRKDNAVAYVGIGIRKGNVFCLSWMSKGQAGITIYQIEKGQRLVGEYTQLGGPGILCQEVLTLRRKGEL
jgi:uncharacterized protein (TIGR03067 family)